MLQITRNAVGCSPGSRKSCVHRCNEGLVLCHSSFVIGRTSYFALVSFAFQFFVFNFAFCLFASPFTLHSWYFHTSYSYTFILTYVYTLFAKTVYIRRLGGLIQKYYITLQKYLLPRVAS